jgi:Protein of unknown function (DUF3467)
VSEQPAQPEPLQRFDIQIAADLEPGVHADFATVWHTPDTFVLDFTSLRRPPHLSEDADTSQQLIVIPARVVSRVRIPASHVFELMKVLEKQLSAWELETGQRPPDDTGLSNLG